MKRACPIWCCGPWTTRPPPPIRPPGSKAWYPDIDRRYLEEIMSPGIYTLGERRLLTAGDDFYIAPGAQVIGSVILGAGASIWFNSVLRADDERIDIGSGSNVQDGTVIHADAGSPAILGRGVSVGHMVML